MHQADTVKQSYFIGSNTSSGFINNCGEVFSRLSRIYVIKGGPGTGKSTFMKRVAERVERAGEEVVRYYCSSDENSLDAIIIPKLGIGITDGTAPHVYEAKYPGVKEIYLNFGEFLNTEFLSYFTDTVKELTDKKGRYYASAYKCLSIAERVRSEKEKLLMSCYNKDKADKAAERLIKALGRGKGASLEDAQISAFGMNGRAYLDTYKKLAGESITVSDRRGASPFFMFSLIDLAREKGLKTLISYDPLRRPEALFFPEKGVCITLGVDSEYEKNINMERFIIREKYREMRKRLRFLTSIEEEFMTAAEETLASVKELHFKLEEIYSEAMDFVSLSAMTEAFIEEKIIKNNS